MDIGSLSRLTASSSSVAATVAPSVRIVLATAAARARVSGVRAVLSAADRDSVVGVGHLADDEAVVPVVDQGQVGPAAGDEYAAALRTDRLDGHPGDVLRGAHAAEAHVHRWCAGVQERLQLGREWAFVGQDPRAGLRDVEIRRLLPRGQGWVRRQPRLISEDVGADVVHRWQADRGPLGVERRAEQRVIALDVQVIQHPVVGHLRRERPTRQRVRRVVRRRQEDRQ